MTIGKLAKSAGVGVETIRFYERRGLIQRPSPTDGYRLYGSEHASLVRFVKRAQELGFTLKEIGQLLGVQSRRRITGAEVRQRAEQKIGEVREKIADLKRMERSLRRLASVCGAGEQAIRECKFFDCFDENCKRRRTK